MVDKCRISEVKRQIVKVTSSCKVLTAAKAASGRPVIFKLSENIRRSFMNYIYESWVVHKVDVLSLSLGRMDQNRNVADFCRFGKKNQR